LTLADQYHDASAVARAFELAWAHSQVEHVQRHCSPEDAQLFQRLASHIIFNGQALRAAPGVLEANRKGTQDLWRHGISGDYPILLVRFGDDSEFGLARELLAAHAFLSSKGLDFDLIFLDEQPATYLDALSRRLHELVRSSESREDLDKPKGVFIRKSAQISEADAILFQTAARVVLDASRGPLTTQLERIERVPALPEPFIRTREPVAFPVDPMAVPELLFANGFGGFSTDGREYLVNVQSPPKPEIRRNGKPYVEPVPYPTLPPAPWINVISNPGFGFLASESGLGYTWSGNSQANRLTPWNNDPVTDPPGEVVYLRDEETGEVWSPAPLPVPSHSPTLVRHGQGYTTFQRRGFGLEHELTVFVSPDDPVKYVLLKLRNLGDSSRSLSATYYLEWVLGTTRDRESAHVVTELDPETGAILARNAFRTDFP
ncbi:GH36-type glycosyl hydrolase domain-containing protein, partial [Singulisphaera rosea]